MSPYLRKPHNGPQREEGKPLWHSKMGARIESQVGKIPISPLGGLTFERKAIPEEE